MHGKLHNGEYYNSYEDSLFIATPHARESMTLIKIYQKGIVVFRPEAKFRFLACKNLNVKDLR